MISLLPPPPPPSPPPPRSPPRLHSTVHLSQHQQSEPLNSAVPTRTYKGKKGGGGGGRHHNGQHIHTRRLLLPLKFSQKIAFLARISTPLRAKCGLVFTCYHSTVRTGTLKWRTEQLYNYLILFEKTVSKLHIIIIHEAEQLSIEQLSYLISHARFWPLGLKGVFLCRKEQQHLSYYLPLSLSFTNFLLSVSAFLPDTHRTNVDSSSSSKSHSRKFHWNSTRTSTTKERGKNSVAKRQKLLK